MLGGLFGALHDGAKLGNADARHDARGADTARTNAHAQGVCTEGDKVFGALLGSDTARNNFQVGEFGLEHLEAVHDAIGMAMRGVDHDEVYASILKGFGSLVRVAERTNRRTDYEAALVVLGRIRVALHLHDVFDRDKAHEMACAIYDGELFDAVVGENCLGFFEAGANDGGDEIAARHALFDRSLKVGFEPNIAVGEDAD